MTLSTEQEAKERWCPLARAHSEVRAKPWWHWLFRFPINRGRVGNPAMNTQCIGRTCMAWRVGEHSTHDVETGKEVYPEKGYCGAFGKP